MILFVDNLNDYQRFQNTLYNLDLILYFDPALYLHNETGIPPVKYCHMILTTNFFAAVSLHPIPNLQSLPSGPHKDFRVESPA